MVRSIIYVSLNTNYRESPKDTGLHSFFDTFSNLRDVFLRNCSSDYSRLELECLFTVDVHWLKFNFTVSVLSTSTRLFCVFTVNVNRFCKCFFVCNLWSTYVSLYLKLTKKSVYDDLKMKLTHSCDDCLTCFLISMCTEGRVFFCQFCKRFTKFTLGSFCLRLDCKLDNRLWEFHRFKNYRILLVTECITCRCELESDRCCDISRIYFIKLFSFICVHLKDTSYTLFFALCSIQYIGTSVHCTRIYSEICQLTNEWVCHNLERKC